MEKGEKIFAKGFSAKRREGAPDWHVCRLGIKVEDAIKFLNEHDKQGYVNINVNTGRSGAIYCELDTYEKKERQDGLSSIPSSASVPKPDSDLPF